jgi:DNA primase
VAFPPAFLDELVTRNPIEDVVSQYVQLTKKGSNLFGLCPFHSEKTASFSVAPDKQIYYCFGCHKGGGVVNFIMEIENLGYADAVRFLAKRAGLEVPEDERLRAPALQQAGAAYESLSRRRALFPRQLSRSPRPKRSGPTSRSGASRARRSRASVSATRRTSGRRSSTRCTKKGYEKQELLEAGLAVKSQKNGSIYDRFRNRLMFPIIDVRGSVIGFSGPRHGRLDAQIPQQSPETLHLQQAQKPLRPERRQKEQAGAHHPDRGLYGRDRAAPVRL